MADSNQLDEMRQEIIQLLRAQLDALANLSGVTDAQLTACYERQERVRQLRDQLSAASDWRAEETNVPGQTSAIFSGDRETAVASV